MFQKGELVLYDIAGSAEEFISPTSLQEEMELGIVVKEESGASSVCQILDSFGFLKRINKSYLVSINGHDRRRMDFS